MSLQVKETLSVRRFKAGYEVREEVIDGSDMGSPDVTMKSAYNIHGDYIGNSKTAHLICTKKGIMPIKAKKRHCVCSIGYSPKDGKWYGWSHRAIYGFKVGQVVGDGSVISKKHAGKGRGYTPGFKCPNTQVAEQMARLFASEIS